MPDALSPSDKDIWNLKQLDSPPIVTLDYTLPEYEASFTSISFRFLLEQHLQKLIFLMESNRPAFLLEKSLLEKLIYKNWNSLRKERAVQSMRRLKKVLNSFETLELVDIARRVNDLTSSAANNMCHLGKLRTLPSREVFEYFIVRIYAAYRLIEFALELIRKDIFFNLMKSIQMAVFMPNNLLFLGTVSRIYCILKKYNESIIFVYNCLRDKINTFKATNIKWSQDFCLDQLPKVISTESNRNKDTTIKLLEDKIDKLDLINTKHTNYQQIFEIDRNRSDEDIGISIERTPEAGENVKSKLMFPRWKRILLKKIQRTAESVFKDTFDMKLTKKFSKRMCHFLDEKSETLNEKGYQMFLQDCVDEKKTFKRSAIFKSSSIKIINQKRILSELKTLITNYISK